MITLRRSIGLFEKSCPQNFGKAHEGENIGFGLIHQHGELCHPGSELIGHLTPTGCGPFQRLPGRRRWR
jgi:hypothetical protein